MRTAERTRTGSSLQVLRRRGRRRREVDRGPRRSGPRCGTAGRPRIRPRPSPRPRRPSSSSEADPSGMPSSTAASASRRAVHLGLGLRDYLGEIRRLLGLFGDGLIGVGRPGGDRRLHGGELRVVDPALLDPGLLATQIAEVVELGSAHCASGDDLELGDRGRMDGERPLDADAEGDLANRECLADAAPLTPDHDALEHLDAFSVTLHHADVHLDGVARPEIGHVGTQEGLLDEGGLVHGNG